jgi:hypothetical protein
MKNSKQFSDRDDDLFSNGDQEDSEDHYINKKGLIHLENDKSVTIDEDDDRTEREDYNNTNHNNNNTNNNYTINSKPCN